MDKKEYTMLVFVLAAAGMLLLLLYSPWGSPDLYNNKMYFSNNQGVHFGENRIGRPFMQVSKGKGGVGSLKTITNAPKSRDFGVTQNWELNTVDHYSKHPKVNRVSNSQSTGVNHKTNRIATYSKISNTTGLKNKYQSVGDSRTLNNGSSTAGQVEPTGMSGSLSINNNSYSSVRNSQNKLSGISVVNVDLSLFGDSLNLEKLNEPQRLTSDPGDGPVEPVPVPDGWGFLIALSLIYIAIKRKLFFKSFAKSQLS